MRELAHQNEALETTIKEDRTYYQGEIDRLRQERDLLSVFSVSIRTRLSTIVEVIHAAEREATESAVAALTRRQNASEEPELALEQPVRPVKPYTADSVQDIADELAKIGGGGGHADYAPPLIGRRFRQMGLPMERETDYEQCIQHCPSVRIHDAGAARALLDGLDLRRS